MAQLIKIKGVYYNTQFIKSIRHQNKVYEKTEYKNTSKYDLLHLFDEKVHKEINDEIWTIRLNGLSYEYSDNQYAGCYEDYYISISKLDNPKEYQNIKNFIEMTQFKKITIKKLQN